MLVRVHRTANKSVRCSLVRTACTEKCEQLTVRTSQIVRTARTTNSANGSDCANSANIEHCERFILSEEVRTANSENGSYCPKSTNSEQCEQFIFQKSPNRANRCEHCSVEPGWWRLLTTKGVGRQHPNLWSTLQGSPDREHTSSQSWWYIYIIWPWSYKIWYGADR